MTRETKKNTTNSKVYKQMVTEVLNCPVCPPNRGCNRLGGRAKHGPQKRKYKNINRETTRK